VSERSIGRTDELTPVESPTRPATRPESRASELRASEPRSNPDLLASLAADLDLTTRVAVRLRPDGLVEVAVAGSVVGFIDHVAPVYVVLAGARPATAVEVAQRRTLPRAVDALRFAWENDR
jgi:hypothetical protein